MNRYETPTFRPAFGLAAAAMTAVTMAFAVVLPVTLACADGEETTLAEAKPAAIEAAPLRIEVVGKRDTLLTATDRARQG